LGDVDAGGGAGGCTNLTCAQAAVPSHNARITLLQFMALSYFFAATGGGVAVLPVL
jgi:hypothetical protein